MQVPLAPGNERLGWPGGTTACSKKPPTLLSGRFKQLRQDLTHAKQYAQHLFTSTLDGLLLVDGAGVIQDANPAVLTMLDVGLGDLRDRLLSDILHWDIPEAAPSFETMVRPGGALPLEASLKGSNGRLLPIHITARAIPNLRDASTTYVCVIHDTSHHRVAQEKILHLAYYDQLTGLPNRALFMDRLHQAIVQAARHQHGLALCCLDLDRFKDLNDTLGHHAGDELLRQVADRVNPLVRRSDSLARLGNDEFVLLLTATRGMDGVGSLASKMLEVLSLPFEVGGQEIHTSASLGIVFFPEDGVDASTLLRNADVAMYNAKANGGNQYQLFSQEMHARLQDRARIESALREAFLTDQLHLVFQPLLNLKDGTLLGAEALCRWVHPELGPVSPARFIPVAEQIGLIRYLGEWVLWTACQYARQWQDANHPWTMWVNVSAAQLQKPDFPDQVAAALRDAELPPASLGLELTESMLVGGEKVAMNTLKRLKALGVTLAMDDFGTGYSSLSYLQDIAVDKLKVDRAFITHLPERPDAQAIVRAIIAMGHSLSLKITAEGIETPEEADILRQLGCDEAQGYFFAHPLTPDAFGTFLERRIHPK